MPFTAQTAIARLTGGPTNAFREGLSAEQQLQRISEVLERFYEMGTWRGVHETLDLVCVSGVVSLPEGYLRLDGLGEPAKNLNIPIKSQSWAFSTSGPGIQDWSKYGGLVAIDRGDVEGVREYQLTGDAAINDARSLKGLARKRFIWISDVATVIVPDCYQALRMGVIALGMEDEGANAAAAKMFSSALEVLNGSLSEFESVTSYGSVQMDESVGMGGVNLV